MSSVQKVRVNCFSISLDGYGAGVEQSLQQPLGVHGEDLHGWMRDTRSFKTMIGQSGGTTDVDEQFVQRGFENMGAWILGRNMFGPVRGPWPDDSWKGWWGPNPPYHVPVFVLTHHARPPLDMEGGTTFHFVTDGIHAALKAARQAANGKDVRLGGGVSVIRQYMAERLVDELHLAVSPVLLGRGESLFGAQDWRALGYRCVEQVATEKATHVVLRRED